MDKYVLRNKKSIIRRLSAHFFYLCNPGTNVLKEYDSFGEKDGDVTYALIQKEAHTNSGLFEDYVNFLLDIEYALSRRWIPVIDRLNCPGYIQQEPDTWNKENAWEYYFEQPIKEATVEYVQRYAKNVVKMKSLLCFDALEIMPNDAKAFMSLLAEPRDDIEKAISDNYKRIASKYLRINEKTKLILEEKCKSILELKTGKILGISLREEMFYRGEATGIKIDDQNLIKRISMMMMSNKCNKIFISSEFESRIIWAVNIWGKDNVLYLPRKRPFDANDEKDKICREWRDYSIEGTKKIMEVDAMLYGCKNEKWLNYLAEIYFLSLCDSAILQVSSGNIGALLMKKESYDAVYIL